MAGMIAMASTEQPMPKVLGHAFLAGLCFLAVFGPNLWIYVSGTLVAAQGIDRIDRDVLYELTADYLMGRDYLDAFVAIPDCLGRMFAGTRSLLILLAAIGAFIIVRCGTRRDAA